MALAISLQPDTGITVSLTVSISLSLIRVGVSHSGVNSMANGCVKAQYLSMTSKDSKQMIFFLSSQSIRSQHSVLLIKC